MLGDFTAQANWLKTKKNQWTKSRFFRPNSKLPASEATRCAMMCDVAYFVKMKDLLLVCISLLPVFSSKPKKQVQYTSPKPAGFLTDFWSSFYSRHPSSQSSQSPATPTRHWLTGELFHYLAQAALATNSWQGWMSSPPRLSCKRKRVKDFFWHIHWIYPPPSNSGKWRFVGIPY